MVTSAEKAIIIKLNTELGNKLRQIKTFYFKSVDPDSKTRSCRSVILKSFTRTAEQKRTKNKMFTVNRNKLHRCKEGVKSKLKTRLQ